MLRSNKKAKGSAKAAEDLKNSKDAAALRIQCFVRCFLARKHIRQTSRDVWQRVFDPTFKKYFWYNRLTGLSSWKQPKFGTLYEPADIAAAARINRLLRGFIGKMRLRKIAVLRYSRFYDAKTNRFYYMDNKTQKTTWNVSKWLVRQNIPLPPEDQMLYDSTMKIKELEEKLKEKDREIKDIRKKRYEELEPEVIKDKLANAKAFKRSPNMDEWTCDELAAWFTELRMDEYVNTLFKERVNGELFINLTEEDWEDLGITNRFHIRKLKLILKAFQVRYQRKKDKIVVDEEDDLLSEYSPSELSDLLAAEDAQAQDEESVDDSIDERSFASDEDADPDITEEQRQEKKLDQKNISIQLLVRGDAMNFPLVGDIVRVRYTCYVTGTEKVVMSTKNVIGKPWVEFVLGIDQVIKGFDRALPQMSVGERSKIIISSEYAYGKIGLPPHVPPDTSITFDLTLLGFRPRSVWVKPLIQDQNTNERPYMQDAKGTEALLAGGNSTAFGEEFDATSGTRMDSDSFSRSRNSMSFKNNSMSSK